MAFLLSNIAAKAAEERKKKESQPETVSSKPSVNSGFFLTKAASEAAAAREQSSTTRQTVQPTPPAQQTTGYDPRRQAARTAAYLQPKETEPAAEPERVTTPDTIQPKSDIDLLMEALSNAQKARAAAGLGIIAPDYLYPAQMETVGKSTNEAGFPIKEQRPVLDIHEVDPLKAGKLIRDSRATEAQIATQLPYWEEKSQYAQKYMPGTAKASAWNGSYYGPGGSTGSEDIVYDYINRRYLPEADAEKVRGIMAVNEANSGLTYKGYENLPENTVKAFNYIYATKGKDEAYKFLNSVADPGMLGAEALGLGVIQGSGALSLATAAVKAIGDVTGNEETKQSAQNMYNDLMREIQQANETNPEATAFGRGVTSTALLLAMSYGIGAIPGLATVGEGAGAVGNIAGNALRTAATFGTSSLIQNIGGAAASDDPLTAYTELLKNVTTSSMAGAAGGAASGAIGAAGTNFLLEHNLYTNALARKIVGGLGSLGFTAGTQTVEQSAAFLNDPKNYKMDGGQILESAVTQLAFSVLAGIGNDVSAEEAATAQDNWNAARNAASINSAEQELAQKYFGGMTEAEAKAEYRRLAKLYHPDTGNGDTAIMSEVTQAYDTVQKYFASLKTTTASTAYADMQTAKQNGDTEGYKNALALLTESVEDLNAYYAENGVPSQDVADALAIVNSVVAAQSPNATPATVPVGSGTTFPPANVPEGGTEPEKQEASGFVGESGIKYTQEQADALAALSNDTLITAAESSYDLPIDRLGISAEQADALRAAGLIQTETAQSGSQYEILPSAYWGDERDRRYSEEVRTLKASQTATDTTPVENAIQADQAAQSEAAPSVTPELQREAMAAMQETVSNSFGKAGAEAAMSAYDPQGTVGMNDYLRDFARTYNAALEGGTATDTVLTAEQYNAAIQAANADRAEALQSAPANATMETEQTAQPAAGVTPYKQAQFEALQNADVTDEWNEPITSAAQIKTYAEAVAADRADFGSTIDFDLEAAEQALSSGEITVYSPRAITVGSFVSPSRISAEDFADGRRIYSMTVPLNAVAWTDAWGGQYTGEMEDINNGREGNGILSGNGNGTRSASAGEQTRGMESRAGESESRNGDGRVSEEAEGGRGENARGIAEPQKVSSAQLGVPGGIDSDSVVRVTEYTTEADKAAKAKAEEYGYKLVGFKGGSLHVKGVGPVRACIVNGTTIYARLDHPDFTGVQLIEHEHTHPLINNGAISLDSVRDGLSEHWSEDALRDFIDGYAAEYPGMTPEEAFVEIVCDAQGGMNIFAADGGAKARVFQTFLDDVKAATDSRLTAAQTPDDVPNGPVSITDEVAYSRQFDKEYMDKARAVNENTHNVKQSVLDKAAQDREYVKNELEKITDYLPPDVEGNTFYSDSSYGGSEENSTICPRSLTLEEFMDTVAEELDHPLTVEDTVFISQDAMSLTDKPECLYCYVAMDRKAYREYLGRYIEQRDAFLKDVDSGMELGLVTPVKKQKGVNRTIAKDTAYGKFLDGRDNTPNMYKRVQLWMSDGPKITKADLASEARMNKALSDSALRAQVEDARAYAQAASWQKKKNHYSAYNNHILKWSRQKVNKLNKQYGLRFYSFSDFSAAFILENMQQITDASVKGLKGLGYNKELDFVRIFASTGINCNVSVYGYNDGRGGVAMDAMQGADWEEAKALRAKYPNVGCTFVATNDAQVDWALNQDWIDVVIPFHIVRTGANVASMFGWTNYTDMSEDRKNPNWHKGNKRHIFPSEHQNDKTTYLKLCEENNLTPRFEKWVDNPNYMKLVNETRQSEAETKPLQPVFTLYDENGNSLIQKSINEFIARGGYMQHLGGTVENMRTLAAETADKIRAGESRKGVLFSRENDTRLGTQKITAGMTDTERYNILSNRKITIHGKTNNAKLSAAEIATKQAINGIKDLTIGERKKLFKKIGEEFGVFKTYNNADVELEFSFSRGNAAESSAKQEGGRYEDFAKMLSCFDEVINDAIGVEVHNRNEKGYKPDATLSNVYVLMSAFEDVDRIVPVKLEIKEFKEKNNTLHVAVALQSIKKSEIVNATKAIDNNGQANASPSLTANIADIFRKINPNDTTFTKYLPIQYRNDALYHAAVQTGDMAAAQRMADEAAKAAGYDTEAYHTTEAEFNVFDRNKLGENTDGNATNAGWAALAHIGHWFNTQDLSQLLYGQARKMYLRLTNPLQVESLEQLVDYLSAEVSNYDALSEDYDNLDWSAAAAIGNDFADWLKKNGYDGIIVDDEEVGGTSYVILDSSQAKSADPVTYDDDGKVIPLSERFNPENQDIRYSREILSPEALEEQNEQLRKDLQAATAALARAQGKAAYWEGQTKRSKAPSPDPTDINRLAHELVGSTDTNLKAKDIAPELTELAEFIMRGGDGKNELTWSAVKERAVGIAHRMLQNYSELLDSFAVQDYKDIRKRVRDYGTIKVPGNDLPPDWTDWKRRHGWLRVAVSTGTPLDVVYTDLSESYPWFFPKDANPGSDQLYALVDGIHNAEPAYWNPNNQDMAAATEYLSNRIIDGVIEDVSQDKTFADRAAKRLSDQKIDAKEKLEAQKAELQRAVQETRARSDERLNNLKAHYKEVQENARARRAEGNMRTRLLKIAKRLQDKKLPTPSRALVNEYVGYIDTVAKNMTGKTRDKLQALSELYNYELENNPDFTRDEAIEKKLSRLNAVRISDLTIEQVQDLIDVLLGLEHQLNTAKRELDSADRRDVYQKGVQIIDDVKGGHTVKPQYMETLDNLFVRNTLSPLRELRRQTGYVDGDPLYEAGLRLNRGQLRMNDYVMKNSKTFDEWVQDKEFMESLTGKKAKTIKVRGTGMDGQPVTVEITPDMRISLYLHNRNLQNQQHISSMSGGVKVPDMKLYRAGKISEAYAKGTRIRLQPSEIRAICENMTAKERALAERIYKYFNTTSRNALSDEFERLKGYMMRFVEDYFPIDTDGSFTKANAEAINFDGSLEGSGWLKERVVNAKNPIMLYDATSVLLKAIQAHGQFVGLAVPIRDFTKLYGMNGPVYDEAKNRIGSQSVKETIKQTWGTGATDYIDKMLGDLQKTHTESNSWTDLFRQIRSNYAGATLALNLSVALKQAGSYPTAAAVLGWRPLARAMADFGKVDLDYIASLTPLQWLRSQGYSTPELGDLKAKGRQLPPALNWIQGMDLLTTRKLWKACEYYMQENHPDLKRGSDQYNGTISELYNRVIEETQPNYTVMQRPQLLRSNNELLRDVSMFKTQLFQNFNIFYDAFGNMAAKHQQYQANPNGETKAKYEEAKKNASRASSALIVQSVVIAAMTLAWNALRGKLKRYKDEEKDKITGWSFAKRFGLDVASGFFSMVPFGSEIFSMISSKLTGEKWYGFEGVTTGALTDFFSTIMTAADQIGKSLEAAKGSNTAAIQKQVLAWEDIAENTAKVFGVPAENVMNLIKAVYGSITKTACGKYYGEYLSMLATTPIENNKGKYYDLLYNAEKSGNMDQFWEIYNSLVALDAMASEKKSTVENIDAALKQREKKDK